MGLFNEDKGEVNKLTIAYAVTILGNVLFVMIASGITGSFINSIVISASATILTLMVCYGKSKLGAYDDKNSDFIYSVYIMQIIITFIVVLFVLYLMR